MPAPHSYLHLFVSFVSLQLHLIFQLPSAEILCNETPLTIRKTQGSGRKEQMSPKGLGPVFYPLNMETEQHN